MGTASFWKTTIAYSKKVATTGALFETSKHVVAALAQPVDKKQKQVIIEFGAGHGNVTKGILERMNPDSILLSFELHKEFCDVLAQNISDPRLHLINDSAGELKKYLQQYQLTNADVIISAIPLTILPTTLRQQILTESHQCLNSGGIWKQVLYSTRATKWLRTTFGNVKYKILLLNMPPACIYTCEKK